MDEAGLAWGVVTNKIERFTLPLAEALGIATRARCIVGGDTTPFAKPHPAPVLHALQAAGTPAEEAIFIGDDQRDIASGRAAGTQTAAAAYGYVAHDADLGSWGADHRFDTAAQLRDWLQAVAER
jgi:phosphoglycolate phosphatase